MNLKTFLKKPLYYSEKCNKTFLKHIDKVKYKSGHFILSNAPLSEPMSMIYREPNKNSVKIPSDIN